MDAAGQESSGAAIVLVNMISTNQPCATSQDKLCRVMIVAAEDAGGAPNISKGTGGEVLCNFSVQHVEVEQGRTAEGLL